MNSIEQRKQKTQIEDIERAAWFARLALGVADPVPLPRPVPEAAATDRQILV